MRHKLTQVEIEEFRAALLTWYEGSRRDLPWRRTRDPYAIWVSETMLQQTRVAAVIPYFERFLMQFPDPAALALAAEQDLLAAWAGLGYYYRARNLQKAAQAISENGTFPDSYELLRELPGVGDYTAAAVASIAFGLPHAVVDGNVLRVLSRVHADESDIGSIAGRKHFAKLAEELLDRERASEFNQAVMELGATVCLPKNPQCLVCPVAETCRARQAGSQDGYPVKRRKQKSVEEKRTLFWIEEGGRVLAWQRPAASKLMPGFWELPEAAQLPGGCAGLRVGEFSHAITFHNYVFEVLDAAVPSHLGDCAWVEMRALGTLPISTVFRKALRLKAKATGRAIAASGR